MAIITLRNKKDFDRIFKHKQVFGNKLFTLLYRKNGLDHNRYAFVVSRKVSKRAVVRNKLRRRLKNYIILDEGRIAKGYDMVLICKAAAAEADYPRLTASVRHLFYKTELMKKE